MTEDLVTSTSSQRSNPRVLRRVRAVPYECCGGVCSFLNAGCFTLCCNGNKSRRRSSAYTAYSPRVQEGEAEKKEEDEPEELSETTKRLIKPRSQDGLTEADLYAFDRAYDGEESDDSPRKQLFVSEFDIDFHENPCSVAKEDILIVETNVDKEDDISVCTDDTSVSGGDGSAKKKKKKSKIMSILKMSKTKKKNKDGTSVTSSATSLAYSEVSEDPENAQNSEVEETILERSEATQSLGKETKDDEVSRDETDNLTDPTAEEKGGVIVRRLHSIFSSVRPKKDDVTISEAHSSPTLGSKSKSATPSPIAAKSRSGTLSSTNSEWQNAEEDIDRMIQGRGSLSGLGLRSDSMASVYSGAGEGRYGTVAVRGQVEFGLQYNYKAGALEIHVKQCKDLAPVDTKRNRSDPYVKVYLLPDKSKSGKRKTKVKKHTLNPVFDENLKFHISLNGLETRTLWLTVWHSDMFGRNDFLGEVMMALENKVFDDPAPVWYNLQERTEPFDDTISFKGDIIVCLKFVPPDMTVQKKGKRSRGTLHVLVKEAKYLTAYKANGSSDPFCKSYLLPDKGRNSKQKTPVAKKTVNPVWNHTFIYEDVTLQELAERCLELTVWDHDRLASNEFLGGVRFSLGTAKHYGKPVEWMDATGKELTLWKSMLERPNFWVEGCLSLRPSLDSRPS